MGYAGCLTQAELEKHIEQPCVGQSGMHFGLAPECVPAILLPRSRLLLSGLIGMSLPPAPHLVKLHSSRWIPCRSLNDKHDQCQQ